MEPTEYIPTPTRPWFRVWRVELIHNESVDFWDFAKEESAKAFSATENGSVVREISEDEIISSALLRYREQLGE